MPDPDYVGITGRNGDSTDTSAAPGSFTPGTHRVRRFNRGPGWVGSFSIGSPPQLQTPGQQRISIIGVKDKRRDKQGGVTIPGLGNPAKDIIPGKTAIITAVKLQVDIFAI